MSSLWLKIAPDSETGKALSQAISSLANSSTLIQGDGPFSPHITICPVPHPKTTKLPTLPQDLSLNMLGIVIKPERFRRVTIAINQTPMFKSFVASCLCACQPERTEKEVTSFMDAYEPHISLAYSQSVTDGELLRLEATHTMKEAGLDLASSVQNEVSEFELVVMDTTGDVARWRPVDLDNI